MLSVGLLTPPSQVRRPPACPGHPRPRSGRRRPTGVSIWARRAKTLTVDVFTSKHNTKQKLAEAPGSHTCDRALIECRIMHWHVARSRETQHVPCQASFSSAVYPLSGEVMLLDVESVPGRTRSLSWTAASVRERAVHQVVAADSPEARQPARATVAGWRWCVSTLLNR